jgi:hypothetical protein
MFTFGSIPVTEDMMRSIKCMLNPIVENGDGRQKLGIKKMKKKNIKHSEKKDDYRPPIGWKSKYMLCAERGFTFYTKYLRELDRRFQGTAQTMLEQYGVQLMFSDESYAYGVNLPITTVMFYNPTYSQTGMMNMSVILAHQAQGRGARRGLDTKGYVIYMGVEHKRLMLGEYLDIQGNNIINPYTTLPIMFNTKFPVGRLSKLSMRQFYDLDSSANSETIASIEQENKVLLCADIRLCFKEVTASPMQMFRLIRITSRANLIQDFFSYIGKQSEVMSIELLDFDLVNGISSMLFPDIMQVEHPMDPDETKYKPSKVIDKHMLPFLERCVGLNKTYKIGQYSDLAVSMQIPNADTISMNELRNLKFVCDILNILCSNNKYATVSWKDSAVACHMRMCNLIFAMCI